MTSELLVTLRTASLCAALSLVAACTSNPSEGPLDAGAASSLDAVLSQAVEEGAVPGVVGLVTGRDSVLYRGAFGVMDAAGAVPMRPDAMFNIASMTKPITSVGVMILVERGEVSLDDAVSTYLPELAGREVLVSVDSTNSRVVTRPPTRPITVRDLLRHTAGFGYTFSSPELLAWTRVSGLPQLQQPLLHDPGERWTYGSSTWFLGELIEAVSGESLDRFLDSRIFTPLGMGDTSFDTPAGAVDRRVSFYRRESGSLRGRPRAPSYQAQIRGDAGLISTADDYARFMQLILGDGEGGNIRLLSPEGIEEMTRDQLPGITVLQQPDAQPGTSRPFPLGAGQDGFGLGFQVDAAENPTPRPPGSLSWAGLQNTHFWIDRENGLGVVLLTQLLPFYDDLVIDMLTSFERTLYEHLQ